MQAAYAAIAGFFDAWGLPNARRLLYRILKSATEAKATRIDPSRVLYFFRTLETLLNAALLIHRNQGERKEAILEIGEGEYPDMSNYAQYFGCHLPSHTWQFFPRALSVKEYANPYRVFKKIARYGEEEKWKFLLTELQDYCFYNSSFTEWDDKFNMLALHRLLQKLLEAAHLVEVRANMEIDGKKRMKWPLHETLQTTST
jgi:hypothetical protein